MLFVAKATSVVVLGAVIERSEPECLPGARAGNASVTTILREISCVQ